MRLLKMTFIFASVKENACFPCFYSAVEGYNGTIFAYGQVSVEI